MTDEGLSLSMLQVVRKLRSEGGCFSLVIKARDCKHK